MPLRKVISGAQTGVDRAALDGAIDRLYLWGGWVPRGRLDEQGQIPERYFPTDKLECGLKETSSSRYNARTILNIQSSDATLILRGPGKLGPGTKLTIKVLRESEKPYRIFNPEKIHDIPAAARWICETQIRERYIEHGIEKYIERNIKTLNVAGPRESRAPGIYEKSKLFFTDVLSYVFIYQHLGARIWAPRH